MQNIDVKDLDAPLIAAWDSIQQRQSRFESPYFCPQFTRAVAAVRDDVRVVVIGAGALGLSTALHCALAGRSVVVVERHTAGSQASGRAAGLFKSVQADELRTRLAWRSITRALSFADWAGVPLAVARSGSFLIARTAQHREYLCRELAQSRRWGADVSEAPRTDLSYYQPAGDEYVLWCPEDVYIEEPASLIRACLAACRRLGYITSRIRRCP